MSRRRLEKERRDRERTQRAAQAGRVVTRSSGSMRRRCSCCGGTTTHVGTVNGVALISGCALRVRRWANE